MRESTDVDLFKGWNSTVKVHGDLEGRGLTCCLILNHPDFLESDYDQKKAQIHTINAIDIGLVEYVQVYVNIPFDYLGDPNIPGYVSGAEAFVRRFIHQKYGDDLKLLPSAEVAA